LIISAALINYKIQSLEQILYR